MVDPQPLGRPQHGSQHLDVGLVGGPSQFPRVPGWEAPVLALGIEIVRRGTDAHAQGEGCPATTRRRHRRRPPRQRGRTGGRRRRHCRLLLAGARTAIATRHGSACGDPPLAVAAKALTASPSGRRYCSGQSCQGRPQPSARAQKVVYPSRTLPRLARYRSKTSSPPPAFEAGEQRF